jgi:hypothetical protein
LSFINTRFSRRDFLIQKSAISAAAILPVDLSAQAGTQLESAKVNQPAAKIPYRDTVLKFNPDGTRRPFAGNTVICHLPVQSVMRDAMVSLHNDLKRASYYPKLGLTSTDSYHMTIFPGANDQDRSVSGWPSYVPMDAPIEICNRMVGERMAKSASQLRTSAARACRSGADSQLRYSVHLAYDPARQR